jgi:hypothetical protein
LFTPDDKSIVIVDDKCIKIYELPTTKIIKNFGINDGESNSDSNKYSIQSSPYRSEQNSNSSISPKKLRRNTTMVKNLATCHIKKEEAKIYDCNFSRDEK